MRPAFQEAGVGWGAGVSLSPARTSPPQMLQGATTQTERIREEISALQAAKMVSKTSVHSAICSALTLCLLQAREGKPVDDDHFCMMMREEQGMGPSELLEPPSPFFYVRCVCVFVNTAGTGAPCPSRVIHMATACIADTWSSILTELSASRVWRAVRIPYDTTDWWDTHQPPRLQPLCLRGTTARLVSGPLSVALLA